MRFKEKWWNMTFCVDIETEIKDEEKLDFEGILEKVAVAVLDMEGCPYEAEVNLLITNDENIHEINLEQRNMDKSTDVLSFPMFEYETPADFDCLERDGLCVDVFNPETGELMLGDIVISIEHVYDQANKYGHSPVREFAFLIAHSMLHLIGYDHMEKEEEDIMFSKQDKVLLELGITRKENI